MLSALTDYVDLTHTEIAKLERQQTVFLMSVSPIEVHGYHLPVGTDVFIAEKLLERYANALLDKRPSLNLVKLPPLYVGSDALPSLGSLSVSAKALQRVLVDYGKGLAKQGFHYLFLADNHGGPRHQLAIEKASRVLWRRYKFYLIDPFNLDFRKMVQHDETLLQETGLRPGICGDDPDSHAGTNETSLMLVVCPDKVRSNYTEMDVSNPLDQKGITKLVFNTGRFFSEIGLKETGKDLCHLANTLSWVTSSPMKPYMGDPKMASAPNGEAMLNHRVEDAVELFEQALDGKRVKLRPILWSLRALRFVPE